MAHEQRLASDYKDQGKLEEAEAHDKNVISTLEEATPPADPGRMALALDELGDVYEAEGRDADAEEVFLHSLQMYENAAPHRIDLAQTLGFHSGRLLNLYRKEGRLNEMETILQRDLSIQEAALGPNDKGLGETLTQLARLYIEENNYDEAVPVYRRALQIQENNLKPYDPHLAFYLDEYADILHQAGQDQEAASVRARAQQIRQLNSSGNSKQ